MSEFVLSPAVVNPACPCGSGVDYAGCCGVCHRDHATARSAAMLMRSRYSAFVLKRADYLLQTWHASTRPRRLDLADDATQWLKLEIIGCRDGADGDARGKVEFKAYYHLEDGIGCLHEISRFRRENGLWFYLDGKIKPALLLPADAFGVGR